MPLDTRLRLNYSSSLLPIVTMNLSPPKSSILLTPRGTARQRTLSSSRQTAVSPIKEEPASDGVPEEDVNNAALQLTPQPHRLSSSALSLGEAPSITLSPPENSLEFRGSFASPRSSFRTRHSSLDSRNGDAPFTHGILGISPPNTSYPERSSGQTSLDLLRSLSPPARESSQVSSRLTFESSADHPRSDQWHHVRKLSAEWNKHWQYEIVCILQGLSHLRSYMLDHVQSPPKGNKAFQNWLGKRKHANAYLHESTDFSPL
jgi:hypothetical protein